MQAAHLSLVFPSDSAEMMWRRGCVDPGRQSTVQGFDTDGSRFFFTIGDHEADIWVADVAQR